MGSWKKALTHRMSTGAATRTLASISQARQKSPFGQGGRKVANEWSFLPAELDGMPTSKSDGAGICQCLTLRQANLSLSLTLQQSAALASLNSRGNGKAIRSRSAM